MFNYLVITENRQHFHLREESGRIYYRLLRFLQFLKHHCPQIGVKQFKGRPRPKSFANLDLILVIPRKAHPDLLTEVIQGFAHVVLNTADPGIKISSPREVLRLELGKRGHRNTARITDFESSFQVGSKLLLAIFRVDKVKVAWTRGTSAGSRSRERKAFFITVHDKALFRGKTGTMHGQRHLPGDLGNQ